MCLHCTEEYYFWLPYSFYNSRKTDLKRSLPTNFKKNGLELVFRFWFHKISFSWDQWMSKILMVLSGTQKNHNNSSGSVCKRMPWITWYLDKLTIHDNSQNLSGSLHRSKLMHKTSSTLRSTPNLKLKEENVSKKLRDVQQEREGTSLNYFKIFFNYIKQFYWSILLYLGLSSSIFDYFGLSWFIFVYLHLSRTISNNLRQSRTILDNLGHSRTISGTIWDYLGKM